MFNDKFYEQIYGSPKGFTFVPHFSRHCHGGLHV